MPSTVKTVRTRSLRPPAAAGPTRTLNSNVGTFGHSIVDRHPIAARLHKAAGTQAAQMLRHGRRSHFKYARQIADAQLAAVGEKGDDLETGFAGQQRIVVGHSPKRFGPRRQASPESNELIR